jgi:hypothetical protein
VLQVNAKDRVFGSQPSSGCLVRSDGVMLAPNFAGISVSSVFCVDRQRLGLLEFGGESLMATRLDAGGELPARNVWTATSHYGESNNADCSRWTTSATSGNGFTGSSRLLERWSSDGPSSCQYGLSFYCVSKTVVRLYY